MKSFPISPVKSWVNGVMLVKCLDIYRRKTLNEQKSTTSIIIMLSWSHIEIEVWRLWWQPWTYEIALHVTLLWFRSRVRLTRSGYSWLAHYQAEQKRVPGGEAAPWSLSVSLQDQISCLLCFQPTDGTHRKAMHLSLLRFCCSQHLSHSNLHNFF